MFTGLSFVALIGIGLLVARANTKDLADKDEQPRHIRQDLRLTVYLLAAILIMLGIIADRIH
jgi:hypothetical protein